MDLNDDLQVEEELEYLEPEVELEPVNVDPGAEEEMEDVDPPAEEEREYCDPEVERAISLVNPASTQVAARQEWASTSSAAPLPDFLSGQTVRALSTHQIHMAAPDVSRRGWQLGGIKLHFVAWLDRVLLSVRVELTGV